MKLQSSPGAPGSVTALDHQALTPPREASTKVDEGDSHLAGSNDVGSNTISPTLDNGDVFDESDNQEDVYVHTNSPPLKETGLVADLYPYTAAEEKAIVRKLDRRLVLFLALLYLLSFLDRSNIGNARIAGLETSLSLQPGQFDWLLTAFYILYIAFEWMTLLYRLIPPHIYISLCVLAWGLVASLQSVSTSFASLLIFRALLGISEAAFGPGVPFYLSFFYKRSELAYRVGLFISAAPLATSCAGTLAWLIVKLSQHGPLEPWRALFLVEGFPSIIVAAVAWHVIPDSPDTTRYLTLHERRIAKLRLQSEDEGELLTASTTRKRLPSPIPLGFLPEVVITLLDPISWLTALMLFGANVSFSSLPVFLPTILSQSPLTSSSSPTHFNSTPSPLTAQILSAPPYLLSFPLLLLTTHLSDTRPDTRSTYIILTSLLSSASYTVLSLTSYFSHSLPFLAAHPTLVFVVRYMCICGAAAGFFSAVTLIITWTINNQRTATGKGVGVALLNVVGQCGPLVGVRLFPVEDGGEGGYVRGLAVCAGFMAGVAGLAGGLRWWLRRLNRRMEMIEGRRQEGEQEEEKEEEEGEGLEMEEWVEGDEQEDRLMEGVGGSRKRGKKKGDGSRFMYML